MLAYWHRDRRYVSPAVLESVPLGPKTIRHNLPVFVVTSPAKVEVYEFGSGWAYKLGDEENTVVVKYVPSSIELSWGEITEHPDTKEVIMNISTLALARRRTVDEETISAASACSARNASPWLKSTAQWLSARAGRCEEKEKDDDGIYCFYPGLRLGVERFLEYKNSLHDCAVHKLLSAQDDDLSPEAASLAIAQVKIKKNLPVTAWDPVNGPGWPGVYTSLNCEGISLAPREDVIKCKNWREAYELMSQVFIRRWRAALSKANIHESAIQDLDSYLTTNEIDFNHFGGMLRAMIPKFITSIQVEACIRWLLSSTPAGRKLSRNHGVGLSAAIIPNDQPDMLLPATLNQKNRVLMRTAIIHLTFQSHASAAAALDFFESGSKQNFQQGWSLEIFGEPLVFSLGGLPITSVAELPEPRNVNGEFCELLRSSCGSFTFTSWWQQDDTSSLHYIFSHIFDADTRATQLSFIRKTIDTAHSTPGCLFNDEMIDSPSVDDDDDDKSSWLMTDSERNLSDSDSVYEVDFGVQESKNEYEKTHHRAIQVDLLHNKQYAWHLGQAQVAVGALVIVGAAAATSMFIAS
mmetsp:Transcript_2836/g.3928  ORF Transcript_2836/g.3928 Transcript_2836/m.3928 type:complete len:579 (-) Transcript_2836:331-2067(-)